ncbi:uncharacterized protein LOC144474729 isoform X2 [Augochlora pura]
MATKDRCNVDAFLSLEAVEFHGVLSYGGPPWIFADLCCTPVVSSGHPQGTVQLSEENGSM